MPLSEEELSRMVAQLRYASEKEQRRLLTLLFVEVKPYMVLMLEGHCRDAGLIEDIVQEVMLRVSRKIDHLRAKTFRQFVSYCLVSARHALVDHHRKAGRRPEIVTDPEILDKSLQERSELDKSPSESLQEREETEAAYRVLCSLDPVCREYLELFFFQSHSYAQIAERFGSTPDAVRVRIARCVKEAAERFDAEGR
jgi:RNA polymerase sigma-70 factor, ECF subfamily